jgi:F420-non-reducing hydrogenase small subunit
MPEGTLHLPVFYDTLKTLDQTVRVDYYLPGCPPEADRIWDALVAILDGTLPEPGSVLGSDTTVCDECPRTRTEKKIKKFYRTWQIKPDPDTCLLEQGLLCCGIATRAGCGALCPAVNSPCIGCYGANNDVQDYGARLMSALASVIDSNEPEEVAQIIEDGIPDPVGSFYRFSLAASLLRRGKQPRSGGAVG